MIAVALFTTYVGVALLVASVTLAHYRERNERSKRSTFEHPWAVSVAAAILVGLLWPVITVGLLASLVAMLAADWLTAEPRDMGDDP